MKYLIFILSLLSFIVAAILLVIALTGCSTDAHAQISAEWRRISGTEEMGVNIIETDEHRLYAAASQGVFVCLDNG